jgi:hypothetical protein
MEYGPVRALEEKFHTLPLLLHMCSIRLPEARDQKHSYMAPLLSAHCQARQQFEEWLPLLASRGQHSVALKLSRLADWVAGTQGEGPQDLHMAWLRTSCSLI